MCKDLPGSNDSLSFSDEPVWVTIIFSRFSQIHTAALSLCSWRQRWVCAAELPEADRDLSVRRIFALLLCATPGKNLFIQVIVPSLFPELCSASTGPERTQIDFISSMEKHNPLRLIWFQHSWVVYPSHYRNNSFKTIHSSFFPSFIAWPLSRSRETTVANPSSLGGPGGCWEQDSSGSWWKWFEVGQFVLEVYGKCDKKTPTILCWRAAR